MILDLSKAFDTVPPPPAPPEVIALQGRLTLSGMDSGMAQGGEKSYPVKLNSRDPRDSIMGLLVFLLYINDIGNRLSSSIKLFADNRLLYREVRTSADTVLL